jgi:putative transposase
LTAKDDELVMVKPLIKLIDDWDEFLSSGYTKEDELLIHRHEQMGRPMGNIHFIKRLESKLERILVPRKGGRLRKNNN